VSNSIDEQARIARAALAEMHRELDDAEADLRELATKLRGDPAAEQSIADRVAQLLGLPGAPDWLDDVEEKAAAVLAACKLLRAVL
jgi:hypothetical protein